MNCVDLSLFVSHVCNPCVLSSSISPWNAAMILLKVLYISNFCLNRFIVVGQRLSYVAIFSYVQGICYAVKGSANF